MFNIRFATDYISYLLTSKTRHGLHSPFVYRLVDEVIYDHRAKPVYAEVEKIRGQLLHDTRTVTVTDLGAGSRVIKNDRRQVNAIAKNALKPPRLAQLLHRLAADSKPDNIIELGTCLGTTTVYLQKAAPQAKIYTLEGCQEIADIAKETFQKAGLDQIELIAGNFDDTLPGLVSKLDKIDFVFVDGNHQKDATLRYFELCLPKVHDDTILIFDDIYWSKGMKEAWEEIKAHPKVTATVDLFWIGLVLFKPGQAKEDFKIRV